MAKQKIDYFALFNGLADFSCDAAHKLSEVLTDFDPEKIDDNLKDLHAIENGADEAKHVLTRHLAKEFLPPVEREDIVLLAQEIDNVTDAIEDVLLHVYMFNIREIRTDAFDFLAIIVKCCEMLKMVIEEFQHFKKSKTLQEGIIAINKLESEGDRIYLRAVRNLYTQCTNPVEVVAWTRTFSHMEKCCDACEIVSEVVESIVMKNK